MIVQACTLNELNQEHLDSFGALTKIFQTFEFLILDLGDLDTDFFSFDSFILLRSMIL